MVWHFQCRINGKKWSRSTGETDKRKALAKGRELEALAGLHRRAARDIAQIVASDRGRSGSA
jgi:hypothetical protein